MVRCSCRSSTSRSVITMTLWNTGWLSSPNRLDSRCPSHAIVFDFPDPRGDEGAIRIDSEVDEGAPGEEKIVRVPAAVLGHGVVGVLPGVRVLELGGGNGQPVDEERHVHGQARVPEAEVQLPRDGED